MWRPNRLTAAILSSGLLIGCEAAGSREHLAHDPLLAGKKPIEKQAENSEPQLVLHTEPQAPGISAQALASAPKRTEEPFRQLIANNTSDNQPSKPAEPVSGLWLGVPAAPPRQLHGTPGQLTARRQVLGDFGHAPDYAWLQGILQRHREGGWELRYCESAVDDRWGGTVILNHDLRLAQFRDGDVVMVEGQFEALDSLGNKLMSSWRDFPRYRLRNARLVRPKVDSP